MIPSAGGYHFIVWRYHPKERATGNCGVSGRESGGAIYINTQSIHGRNLYREGKVVELWFIRHLKGISISLRTSPIGMILPQESYSGNESVDSLDIQDYLHIWNGPQGGIYKYDFYYPSLAAGDIYLRCYEATKNIPLSKERVKERSTVPIESTYSFSQVVDKKEFTIYEGDWGDYYAARIEVWHRDANTGKEKKLMEKVYRVEGWMR